MKKTLLAAFLVVGLIVAGMCGVSEALVYSDTYNPNKDITLNSHKNTNHVDWVFDITKDLDHTGDVHSGVYGFNPLTQDVLSATILFSLNDLHGHEVEAQYRVQGNGVQEFDVVNGINGAFTINVLTSLNYDGSVNAALWSTDGTFDFNYATLSADTGAAPVPEPGTMMLLGFGMLGLVVYGKRRMNKEA